MGDNDFLFALQFARDHIRFFVTDIIFVALGLDAGISDPFERLTITTEGFRKIANQIAKLGKPLTIVQEDG